MDDDPFRVMWVVELEVQITTCMSRFLVHFCGQFMSDQNVLEWKGVISFNFHCEFDGRSNAVEIEEFAAVLLVHVAKPQKCC
jgi:hypothetical protein